MGGRMSKQGWVRGVGLVALLGLVGQFAAVFLWVGAPVWLWRVGLGCAVVALFCGLIANGRAWTMTLVVPSVVFLFLLFS